MSCDVMEFSVQIGQLSGMCILIGNNVVDDMQQTASLK